MQFAKGHGTQNDFIIIADAHAAVDLTVAGASALCDRRQGLGADGILRVARAGALITAGVLDALPTGVAADDWFMDYRNADGSIAEMCGNGVRVFAHYLLTAGLTTETDFTVGSRAGGRPVVVESWDATSAVVRVDMGAATLGAATSAQLADRSFAGVAVDVGNPHLAAVDPTLDVAALRSLDLTRAPRFDHTVFPDGVNVEFLTARSADGSVDMRVYERGVGETRSCGTGTVAAAYAALHHDGQRTGSVRVRIPGGAVRVDVDTTTSYLTGPSVLLAHGDISDSWWATFTRSA